MEKLNIAVIGCGNIFRCAHLPAYHAMEDVRVVALCDILPERTQRYAPEFPDAQCYTDYEEVLRRPDVDAVDICTPNDLHAPIACAALRAGKHVFCEKPDAISPELAQQMQQTAESCGRTLMVMRNNRFAPASRFARSYIQSGAAGDLYAAHCAWQRRRGIPGKGGWFTTKARSGGGPLIDLGVHMIDLALWLMGNPKPVSVTGCTYSKFADNTLADSDNAAFGDAQEAGSYDVEDLAMGFVRLDNGACLTIEFSWASNVERERRFVELYGTKAGLKWEDDALYLFEERNDALVDARPCLPRVPGNYGHEQNLRNFADVLLHGAQPCYVPQQGVDMVRLLCALYESARTGREVRL